MANAYKLQWCYFAKRLPKDLRTQHDLRFLRFSLSTWKNIASDNTLLRIDAQEKSRKAENACLVLFYLVLVLGGCLIVLLTKG